MDINSAQKLSYQLRRTSRTGLKIRADIVTKRERIAVVDENGRAHWSLVETGRIVFSGGKFGPHSIELSCSDEARVMSHWEGYIASSGMLKPEAGQAVMFESASASRKMGGLRYGRVLKVGTKRAVVEFTYKHGGRGTATVRFESMRWMPKA